MGRFSLLCLLVMAGSSARAELGQNPAPQGQQPQQQQGPRSSAVQIWDDRVFDLGEKAPPPTTRKSANGTERYLGPDADYNSGQRGEWLATCEAYRADLRSYRDCFDREKRKASDKVKADRDEVESRTSVPLRNVPLPKYDSEGGPRNPTFDVQIEREEEE